MLIVVRQAFFFLAFKCLIILLFHLLQLRVYEEEPYILQNRDPQTYWQGESLHSSIAVH